jgi:phosphatidylglycerol:prolipoprotein diacylglycerol transferase
MTLLEIPYPNINPVAIELGPFVIKWYGLAYLTGLLLGWAYIRRLLSQPRLWRGGVAPFSAEKVDDLLLYMTAGVILGGRLGFVLFYEPQNYLAHPLEVFQVWKGGMAFHGALIGCGLAIWAFARRNRVNVWSAMDACCASVPLGLLFGRLANFVNGELYGRPSTVPWAMVFPEARLQHPAVEPTPRHPSQLYESFTEGLVLFLVLRLLTHRFDSLKRPGLTTGVFLLGYGCARILCEFFREPHFQHALNFGPFSVGQVYSLPMVAVGLWLIWRALRAPASEAVAKA